MAIGELADGLTVDLDRVSKKYEGLDGTELAISESQERMAVVLDPKDVPAFLQAAHQENLEAQQVAEVTENPRLKMNWRGDLIVDLSREFLNTNGVTQRAKAKITAVDPAEDYRHLAPKALRDLPVGKAFEENLKRLEVCSQKGLSERFDSSIGAGTDALLWKIPADSGRGDGGENPVAQGRNRRRYRHDLRLYPGHFPVESLPRRRLCGGGIPVQAAGGRRRPGRRPADLSGIF